MRTRAHNAGVKKWRIVNERKAAKAVATDIRPRSRAACPIAAGQRFDHLVAVEPSTTDAKGNRRWVFTCDCGQQVTWRVSTVVSNVRRLGWCSCPDCYRKAGSWQAITEGQNRPGRMTRTNVSPDVNRTDPDESTEGLVSC
jgi:hypothetical protein